MDATFGTPLTPSYSIQPTAAASILAPPHAPNPSGGADARNTAALALFVPPRPTLHTSATAAQAPDKPPPKKGKATATRRVQPPPPALSMNHPPLPPFADPSGALISTHASILTYHPPVLRTDAERRKWNRSEGARKRSARRWTNWGLTPPGKLARYINAGEGSSSGQSSRAPRLPVADSSDDDDLIPARSPTFSAGDYVHGSDEEDAVLAQTKAIGRGGGSRALRREEAEAVRLVP
nr:formin-like protein 13 [Lolium perenne]